MMTYDGGEGVCIGDRVRSNSDGARGLVTDFDPPRDHICVEFDAGGHPCWQHPCQYRLVARGK